MKHICLRCIASFSAHVFIRRQLAIHRAKFTCVPIVVQIMRPEKATPESMTMFHSDEYIEFLRLITPDNQVQI